MMKKKRKPKNKHKKTALMYGKGAMSRICGVYLTTEIPLFYCEIFVNRESKPSIFYLCTTILLYFCSVEEEWAASLDVFAAPPPSPKIFWLVIVISPFSGPASRDMILTKWFVMFSVKELRKIRENREYRPKISWKDYNIQFLIDIFFTERRLVSVIGLTFAAILFRPYLFHPFEEKSRIFYHELFLFINRIRKEAK